MEAWKKFQEENQERFLEELKALLRIPSISSSTPNKPDMLNAADLVKKYLLDAGVDNAEIFPTAGHPVVYGEKIVDVNKPTVLVYGHYDVQPVDPIELWHTDPFEPTVKEDGNIYGRGTADDKGQFFMHVKAFEILSKTDSIPLNVKFIFEGEEEIGSPHLKPFLQEHKDLLKADVVLVSDTSMQSLENPSIDAGVRGLAYLQVEITGPNRDLHSGVYGGAVANPINILAKLIAGMHDENNHITIPGFYDDVDELSAEERKAINKADFDQAEYTKDLGVGDIYGEKGYTTVERTGIRPTMDVNGIWGGFMGEGAKTVLPSKAFAKISFRLVPHQSNEKITEMVVAYLKEKAPASVEIKVTPDHGGDPYVTPIDSVEYLAAQKAIEATFGKRPIPIRGGGSIPITALFESVLGCSTVLLGFGLDSDNLHSPNEKYGLKNFYKGIETIPYFHKYYAELKK
ncbi:dipeptidase [Rhizosphaericola mali]|uniref:Dipeptidase n=1 Tax=Rhizosphaericola mali TaxID=2545455 RepID=A0A5P2G1F1_9BACT|nr:dipeptidase [Rhizosphaericola mali]QES87662.1 dipeptidase [Rhizosphaericola mali]